IARPIEDELRQSARHLAQAQRVAATGSLEIELGSDRTRGSAEMHRILGAPEESGPVTVERLRQAVHPEDRERFNGYLEAQREGGGRSSLAFRILRPDGEVRRVTAESELVLDDAGRPRSVVHALKDVTDLWTAEHRERE